VRRVLPIISSLLSCGPLLIGGCVTNGGGTGPSAAPAGLHAVVQVDPIPNAVWRGIASDTDRSAIDDLSGRWENALSVATRRFAARVRGEGSLVEPEAGQPLPALSPGPYLCRLVRLGGKIGYATYKPDNCYVDGDAERQSFTKQNGSSLPGGWLYTDDQQSRIVFLGTNRFRRDDAAPAYGDLPGREMAGIVERVSPFRWRLVLARPLSRDAAVELYELVPVPPQPVEAPAPVTERRSRSKLG